MERKTHREDWTGEKSVKARFPIQEHLVNDYLSGKMTMDETFENLRKKGKKSDKEVDSMIKLAREVQAAIRIKKLQPGECAHAGQLPVSSSLSARRSDAHVLQPHCFPVAW